MVACLPACLPTRRRGAASAFAHRTSSPRQVTALRAAFGDDLRKILIANSKGITGHAMGVCFEDVLCVASLTSGLAPPIVHHQEADPALGPLRLSRGGRHDCRYALHFAAGFGSQITYVLYARHDAR